MAVVAITLCEGLLLVRQYSRRHGYKADGDQVLFAYGVANLAAGLSGALVTGNSQTRRDGDMATFLATEPVTGRHATP